MQSFAIAASALIAQGSRVGVIADNIANAETPGYATHTAVLISTDPGVKVGTIMTIPRPVPFTAGVSDQGQGADLAAQFGDLMLARTAYEAALKVIATSTAMSDALLQTA